jgi:hypothetical protein
VEPRAVCFSTRQKLTKAAGIRLGALIHHFNPACRIARAYPAYPVFAVMARCTVPAPDRSGYVSAFLALN